MLEIPLSFLLVFAKISYQLFKSINQQSTQLLDCLERILKVEEATIDSCADRSTFNSLACI